MCYIVHVSINIASQVEDFWGVYNNLMQPSELDKNANYHIFKQGIKPLWEHKDNRHVSTLPGVGG